MAAKYGDFGFSHLWPDCPVPASVAEPSACIKYRDYIYLLPSFYVAPADKSRVTQDVLNYTVSQKKLGTFFF